MTHVVDASAVLGLMLNEPGGSAVMPYLDDAILSSVNHSEVVGKLASVGMPAAIADGLIDRLQFRVVPFTRRQARIAGELRARTAHLGLSLGDRACLATALDSGGDVVTLDRAWGDADLGVPILLLR